jgi:hypothetical protein
MKTIEYSFVLRAASPIAHHSGVKGNVGIINRETVVLPRGELREVPIVSGNSMRHGLRAALADLTLDALGLLKPGAFASPDSIRFLYNGGAGSGSEGTLRLDEIRAMHTLVPSSALLGGSSRGMIHHGRLEVGAARLVCAEVEHELEQWQREAIGDMRVMPAVAYETLLTEYRHDESVKPQGRFLLTSGAQTLIAQQQSKRERAGEAEDDVEIEESKGGQMPYSGQAVIGGSLWTWSVVCHAQDELDEITVQAGLSAFLRRAVVGGRRRVGYGRFVVHASRSFDHLRPAEALRVMTADDVMGPEKEAPFVAHVKSRADEARKWLGAST